MMKVTRTTLNTLQKIRHERNKKVVTLQRLLKSGKWGKACEYEFFGCEKTAEEVIARLERNNPGDIWRIAE
jgi:hypothetical protein